MLIDATYFIGELNIANRDQASVQSAITHFIGKYEDKYLYELMGKTLYEAYLAGIVEVPIPTKWTNLQDKIRNNTSKVSPIASYVYWWYMRNQASQTVGMGQAKPAAENAVIVSNIDKMVRSWNEMVDQTNVIAKFINDNKTDYPDYPYTPYWNNDAPFYVWNINGENHFCYPEIFHKKNTLGL